VLQVHYSFRHPRPKQKAKHKSVLASALVVPGTFDPSPDFQSEDTNNSHMNKAPPYSDTEEPSKNHPIQNLLIHRFLCLGCPVERSAVAIQPGLSAPMDHDQVLPPKPPFKMIKAGKPDFSGDWMCSDIAGDMEQLMVALEVSWPKRAAARCVNYGVGRAIRVIRQEGNQIAIDCLGTPQEFTQKFHIGRGPQQTVSLAGTCQVTPTWEHGYVLSVAQHELDGSPPMTWKQYFLGEDLVLKIIAENGESAAWVFSRR